MSAGKGSRGRPKNLIGKALGRWTYAWHASSHRITSLCARGAYHRRLLPVPFHAQRKEWTSLYLGEFAPGFDKNHPVKAKELYTEILSRYHAGTVIDVCMNTGIAGEAAIEAGYCYVGIEILEPICKKAKKRLDGVEQRQVGLAASQMASFDRSTDGSCESDAETDVGSSSSAAPQVASLTPQVAIFLLFLACASLSRFVLYAACLC